MQSNLPMKSVLTFSDDMSLNLNKDTNPVVGSTLYVYAAGT